MALEHVSLAASVAVITAMLLRFKELKPALLFGVLLVLVLLLGEAAIHYFGETGLFLLAFVSGIADVDSINLTLSRMSITAIQLFWVL